MNEKLLSREDFLRSGFKKIGDFIDLIKKESHSSGPRATYIRPPASVGENAFLGLCDKCGLCVGACPKKIITLIDVEDEAVCGTPVVMPGEEQCDFCLKCVDVCKTGALRYPEDRSSLKLGIAEIDRKNCLTWDKNIICNLCRYRCPHHAIESDGNILSGRPVVNHSNCNGCGLCQYVCPSSPKAVKIVNHKQGQGILSNGEVSK